MILTRVEFLRFVGIIVFANFCLADGQIQQRQESSTSWITMIRNAFSSWLNGIFGGSNRIAGGQVVTSRESRPYMAVISYHPVPAYYNILRLGICSGTILTVNKVLTGASCFSIIDGANMSVYIGALDVFKKKPKGVSNHKITKTVLYTGYSFSSNPIRHDLAIAYLDPSMTFNSKVSAVSLPASAGTFAATTYYGQTLTTVGYGLEQEINIAALASGGASTDTLKSFIQPIKGQRLKYLDQTVSKNDSECLDFVSAGISAGIGGDIGAAIRAQGVAIFSETICVTGPAGSGSCWFDNGGPMLNSGGTQVGVVGLLMACTNSSGITIGTELSDAHLTWVKTEMQK